MSDQPITIRHATAADFEELLALFAEGDQFHHEALPRVFRAPRVPPRSREYLAGLIADLGSMVLVADADGVVAGLVVVSIHETPDMPVVVPRRYAFIESLVVRAAWRRQGIGTRLIAAAEAWAREHGVREVELTVWEFNQAALALYERLGYTTATRRLRKTLPAARTRARRRPAPS
jgi:shikimate dehydrogenase